MMDVATEEAGSGRWQALGASVRGAAHLRDGRPNQDALRLPEPRAGSALFVALADGHGSARHSRSHRGSRFAVDALASAIEGLLGTDLGAAGLSLIKREAEERLPRAMVASWREAVRRDLEAEPLTDEELQGIGHGSEVEQDHALAYGSTLLAVAVTERFLLYMQLGDGDILVVGADGEVSRPLPHDDRLLANETTSLCSAEAWRECRVVVQAIAMDDGNGHEAPPVLVLLATDGLTNSFRDEEGFRQVASDLLQVCRSRELVSVHDELDAWLHQVSEEGSGDDVTVALLKRIEDTDAGSLLAGQWRLAARQNAHEAEVAAVKRRLEDSASGLKTELAAVSEQLQTAATAHRAGLEAVKRRLEASDAARQTLERQLLALRRRLLAVVVVLGLLIVLSVVRTCRPDSPANAPSEQDAAP